MKLVMLLAIALGFWGGWGLAEGVVAGGELALDLPQLDAPVSVRVPDAYDPEWQWPVLLHFPGSGENPDNGWFTDHAGLEWVLVALPDPAEGARELVRDAVRLLAQRVKIDPRRVFVGGVSKGGWQAEQLFRRDADWLAGGVFVLAGVARGGAAGTRSSVEGRAIYAGAGQRDPSLMSTYRARAYYERLGAIVTLECFSGMGHALPPRAEGLARWFEANGHYRNVFTSAKDHEKLRLTVKSRYDEAMALQQPLGRYRALLELQRDPLLRICGGAAGRAVANAIQDQSRDTAVKAERRAADAFGRAMLSDANLLRVSEMQRVVAALEELVEGAPETEFGKVAALFAGPTRAAYDKSVAATAAAQVRAAAPPPSVPPGSVGVGGMGVAKPDRRRPVQEGNRVRFE